jgi:hypothetical protein
VLQIQAAENASRTFVRRAKPKRIKIAAGNPNRRMNEVAVTLLSKTCPKRGKSTLIVGPKKEMKMMKLHVKLCRFWRLKTRRAIYLFRLKRISNGQNIIFDLQ